MSSALDYARELLRSVLPGRVYAKTATAAVAAERYLAERLWWLTPAGRANRGALAALRGRHAGRRCFVIGNGPSLLRTDLRPLRREITIGCNAIYLHLPAMGFLPSIYTVEDNLVAEDRAAEINMLRGPVKIFPRGLAYCLCAGDETLWIDFRYRYRGFPRFSANVANRVFWGGTVTFLNLQIAYHLGCKEVFLVGVDHLYHVPQGITSDQIMSERPDVNHFHPDYFGPGYRWHDPKVARMETAYRAAKAFSDAHGMAIFNATKGGELEVFPRVDYERLFDDE